MNNIEKYPVRARLLGRNNPPCGLVVEFVAPKEGVVVEDPHSVWGVGHYSSTWNPVTDSDTWEILSNESPKNLTYGDIKNLQSLDADVIRGWLVDNHPNLVKELLAAQALESKEDYNQQLLKDVGLSDHGPYRLIPGEYKVPLIKVDRARTGRSLKDSKEYIEGNFTFR